MKKDQNLIILINGNYIPLLIAAKDVDQVINSLQQLDNSADWISFPSQTMNRMRKYQIDGWYMVDVQVPVVQQMLDEVKKMAKDSDSGESWRDES